MYTLWAPSSYYLLFPEATTHMHIYIYIYPRLTISTCVTVLYALVIKH